mmetsp:Transcript_21426/g.30013  ORF Transcript_21426/g.30013 Transcript_21426/m.30013 type:complete len:920 (+) Transcript_21426:531-3290(+)|eukprot:CAMPEP_0184866034 /NCGR_PEP_ID=MMETSP0580-20130426/20378_1 /TAXON_ID=1118495 /ORGANISM="Dactyliosolen fragilissimus" /LENGTH=919 /DNA_ID=CAMNT_0027365477 /DNA_START=492 /DNA_END=3251 /DNA_ORIENTATION=+
MESHQRSESASKKQAVRSTYNEMGLLDKQTFEISDALYFQREKTYALRGTQRQSAISPPTIQRQGVSSDGSFVQNISMPIDTNIGPKETYSISSHPSPQLSAHVQGQGNTQRSSTQQYNFQQSYIDNQSPPYISRPLPQSKIGDLSLPHYASSIPQSSIRNVKDQNYSNDQNGLIFCREISSSPNIIQSSPASGTSLSSMAYQGHGQQSFEISPQHRLRPSSATSMESTNSTESVSSSFTSHHNMRLQALFRPISSGISGRGLVGEGTDKNKKQNISSSGGDEDNTDTRSTTAKSPLPQNLRGDPFRSAKVKTELCRYYNTEKGCPFGDKCNYAHGEHQLKYTKLMDLERAGLVDIEVFRTHPCFTWVSTGACPFDQRCMCLHDPRITGSQISWLPHAETLINSIGSSVNVDQLYHQRIASVYSSSPIHGYAPATNWKENERYHDVAWKHFYRLICNNDSNFSRDTSSGLLAHTRKLSKWGNQRHVVDELTDEHVMEIALMIRKDRMGQSYAYLPTHLFCGELCMVLQIRQFELSSPKDKKSDFCVMKEVTSNHSAANSLSHNSTRKFKVYEIVFGPTDDPSVTSLSIWFNISEDDIIPCTSHQAKRHKRSRHRLKKVWKQNKNSNDQMSLYSHQHDENPKQYESTRIPPFYEYQPHDNTAFDLITKIMHHHLTVCKVKRARDKSKTSKQFKDDLHASEQRLRAMFRSLRRFWMTWSWPVMLLKEQITDQTDVPPVNGKYFFSVEHRVIMSDKYFSSDRIKKGNLSEFTSSGTIYLPAYLWKSFITNIQLSWGRPISQVKLETVGFYDKPFSRLRRLPIFRNLSMGKEISAERGLLCLKTNSTALSSPSHKRVGDITIESLFQEWKIVEAHYDKSQGSTSLRISQSTKDNLSISENLSDWEKNLKEINSATTLTTRMPF